jgi:predicted Fe-Mo cluster-binding NifX family protein
MIAIPVKTNKPESAVAPLFGKAKWFALIDQKGQTTFWKNELKSGREVVDFFTKKGITTVIFQDMGGNPFLKLEQAGITCYHSGEGRILLQDLHDRLLQGELNQVTTQNMASYVEQSQRHSSGEHHHHDHDDHHHTH